MKIKPEFILRPIASSWVIFSLNMDVEAGMQLLNNSAALLWRQLENGCTKQEMVTALTDEYEVSQQQAQTDVEEFLDQLRSIGCIDES